MDSISCNFTPSTCHIDLGALARNFIALGKPEKLMPVIKADAYGHGLLQVAYTLNKCGAKNFAVGTVSEGIALRKRGFSQTIVPLLGCLNMEECQLALNNALMPVIGNFADLDRLESVAQQGSSNVEIAIKCDTGMSRLGFGQDDIPFLLERLDRRTHLRPAMLISHLACADMPEELGFTNQQIKKFNAFYESLKSLNYKILRSLGNSAATLGLEKTHFDLLRPGLVLYGYSPFESERKDNFPELVMSVSTPIIHVRDLEQGQSVSYGRAFTAQRPMRIAITACGYATGFNRSLSNRSFMMVNGKRARQVGRVCMSMTMLDITDIKDAKPGDRAWILGGPASEDFSPITASEIAALLDTIPYEILCQFGAMNPRQFTEWS